MPADGEHGEERSPPASDTSTVAPRHSRVDVGLGAARPERQATTQGRLDDGSRPVHDRCPQAKLEDIHRRGERYPWDALPDLGDWRFGPPAPFMRRVAECLLGSYDWRAAESGLNRFPNLAAEVQGIALPGVLERGSGNNPAPLVLIHGWPSSVYDYYDLIEPLAHPERFGGDASDGVDVVVPSVAGYGWSGRPPGPQVRRREAGQIHQLVTESLAYDRYIAASGDFGAMIAGRLALDHPEAIAGIYLTAPNL